MPSKIKTNRLRKFFKKESFSIFKCLSEPNVQIDHEFVKNDEKITFISFDRFDPKQINSLLKWLINVSGPLDAPKSFTNLETQCKIQRVSAREEFRAKLFFRCSFSKLSESKKEVFCNEYENDEKSFVTRSLRDFTARFINDHINNNCLEANSSNIKLLLRNSKSEPNIRKTR